MALVVSGILWYRYTTSDITLENREECGLVKRMVKRTRSGNR